MQHNLHDLYFLLIAPCCFCNLTPSGMLRRTVREYRANEMTWIPGNGKIAWQAFDGRDRTNIR